MYVKKKKVRKYKKKKETNKKFDSTWVLKLSIAKH